MIHFIFSFNTKGQMRLQRWYSSYKEITKKQFIKDVVANIQLRTTKNGPFFEYNELTIVYKRYAALYFVMAIDPADNEILTLEIIQRYVECLDKYFSNVCELDIIFSVQKANYILDEFIMNGEVVETSREQVVKAVKDNDHIQQNETNNNQSFSTHRSG